jgi:IS30 family transposase
VYISQQLVVNLIAIQALKVIVLDKRRTKNRRKNAVQATKMTPVMIALVESKLQKKLSPEQISGWLLEEKEVLLNHEIIYRHIWADKAAGGDLYT